jgi:LysM repeat protein
MTREQKLALIVGFALVLVVGVLISDQLSVARRPVDGVGGGLAMSLEPTTTDAYPGFGRPLEPQPVASTTRRFPIDGATQVVLETPGLDPVADPVPVGGAPSIADAAMQGLSNGIGAVSDLMVEAQNNGIAAYQAEPIVMGEPVGGAAEPERETIVPTPPMAQEAPNKEPVRAVKTHRVVEGDTLWSIAKKHYGDGSAAEALAKYNEKRIGKGGLIREGASLLIPDRAELGLGGSRTAEAKPETKATTKAATRTESKTAEKPKADGAKTYTVKSGDTLQKISQKLFGTTKRWTALADLNSDVIDDEDNLRVGTVLKVPSR